MNFRLRTMTFEDIPAAMRLKDLAGWNQTAADWARFVSASPEGCFVMECDGKVIGTSSTIAYDGRFSLNKTTWFPCDGFTEAAAANGAA